MSAYIDCETCGKSYDNGGPHTCDPSDVAENAILGVSEFTEHLHDVEHNFEQAWRRFAELLERKALGDLESGATPVLLDVARCAKTVADELLKAAERPRL